MLNISIYGILVRLYPDAGLWNRTVSFSKALWFVNFYFATVWLVVSVLVLSDVIILHHIFSIELLGLDPLFRFLIAVAFILPVGALLVRSFWSYLKTIFALSHLKFLACLVVAWLISWAVSPAALLAAFFVIKAEACSNFWFD